MRKKLTDGQKLMLDCCRCAAYETNAATITVAPAAARTNPARVTKRWSEGMSRHLRERFATGVRELREKLGGTQQELADLAGLTVTAVAMIERGERTPTYDTASRICWALDMAAGMTLEDIA